MEKNIKYHVVTTTLEYDKDGDVIREERREETEYFEPESETKVTIAPIEGYVTYNKQTNAFEPII